MVDEGVLGEIIYMRGGYRHDLRKLLLDDNGVLGGRKGTESVWRSRFYSHHNADIYPTHGLGPLCMILGIGKTDHLAWLTSFATKAVGLRQHMSEMIILPSPWATSSLRRLKPRAERSSHSLMTRPCLAQEASTLRCRVRWASGTA